ncbi:STAS domain-containing protein [Sphingomonas crusticola]|uniref:STAS domain-containing protein n=1 Tax=Sphingomonas crusticola TaxID=1697973 RepID=UPI001F087C76|nr:STAS domain-containing protein [Sphingomonas crusticola]
MSIQIADERAGEFPVIVLRGRLDSTTSSLLDARLGEDASASAATIIDMTGLDYVSSAGLRVLLKAAKQAKARSARLLLCTLHPNVQEVFDISGFSAIFSIYPDRAAAAAAA